MKPKLSLIIVLSLFVSAGLVLPSAAKAWAPKTHNSMCPDNYGIDCNIADSDEFMREYPFGGKTNHLCLDNKSDCLSRLVAKYYLKKYYVEGEEDLNLLGAAAHLLQDAACPEHWYPKREYFGKVFVPFAPGWLNTVEFSVEDYLGSAQPDWNISVNYRGETININQAYLNAQKELIQNYLSQEPSESLEEIEAQINSQNTWAGLRSYKEVILLAMFIVLLLLVYSVWKWKKKKTGLVDLIVISSIFVILGLLLLLILIFY